MVIVFMWVPSLQAFLKDTPLPTGLVFACFMLCVAIGGKVFEIGREVIDSTKFAIIIVVCAIAALLVPCVSYLLFFFIATLFVV